MFMMASVLKLTLVCTSTLAFHVASTPPHQPATIEIVHQTLYERLLSFRIQNTTQCFRTVYWLGAIAEIASVLARNVDPAFVPHALQGTVKALGSLKEAPITPTFVIGSVLTTCGGLLRWQCYRTLGRHFTFVLSVRKEHRLITSGPYAIVRHPSYTGLTLCVLGALLMHGPKNSFLRSSGIFRVPGVRVLALAWAVGMVGVVGGLLRRMPSEDEMLKAAFGEEWKRWARRVKYMLIPGVY